MALYLRILLCSFFICTVHAQFQFQDSVLIGCFHKDDPNLSTPITLQTTTKDLASCRTACGGKDAAFFAVSKGNQCNCFQERFHQAFSRKPSPTSSCYGEDAIQCENNMIQYCGTTDHYLIYSVCPQRKANYKMNCADECQVTSGELCINNNYVCNLAGSCETTCYPNFDDSNSCNPCPAPAYGYMCASQCDGNFTNPECGKVCPPAHYGDKCSEVCNNRCLDSKCDNPSGHCSACPDGLWGKENTCLNTCPGNCSSPKCDISNGTCVGCSDGFFGATCGSPCPQNCSVKCRQSDGDCRNGCVPNTWGERCDLICPENCTGSCNQENGTCKSCNIGWTGPNCNVTCPANCANKKCDIDSGNCTNCIPGYTGKMCNISCPANCLNCSDEYTCDKDGCKDRYCDKDGCKDGYCGNICDLCPTTTKFELTTVSGNDKGDSFPVVIVAGAGGGLGLIIIIVIIVVVIVVVRRKRQRPPPPKPPQANGQDIPCIVIPPREFIPQPPQPGNVNPAFHLDPERTYPQENPVSVDNLKEYVNSPEAKENIKKEYADLPSGKTKPWTKAEPLATKNRYKRLYAYDHSRVELSPDPDDPSSDYINANYMPNFNRKKAFIACQGPHNDEVVADFIRMLWEYKITAVVAMARLEEVNAKGKPDMKFHRYWPETIGKLIRCGKITVKLVSEELLPDYTIRELVLKKDGKMHKLTQFHFTSWSDQGVPQTAAPLLTFHSRVVRHMQLHHIHGSSAPPVVVHCSAGIGRTGVYIALDALLQQINREGVADIPACVKRLREDRVNMVQKTEQYSFIYDALCESMDLGHTTLDCSLFTSTLEKWATQTQSPSPIEQQYNLLEKMKPEISKQHQEYALSDSNSHKNRFRNIVAATERRIQLASGEYINAIAVDGHKIPDAYHVTQMPLENTVADFWTMVWEKKYPTIVALLTMNEQGVRWCPAQSFPLQVQNLQVTLSKEKAIHKHIMEMDLEINQSNQHDSIYENAKDNEQQQSNHAYADAGTDTHGGGAPHAIKMYWVRETDSRSMRQTIQLIRPLVTSAPKRHPVCIMCLDGCQNCGLYVACHNVVDMADKEGEVDVFETVQRVRANRPQFIKDLEQYNYIYTLLKEYLASKTR